MNGHVTRWIPAYLDGELRPAQHQAVEAHLANCAACRLELEDLHRLSALLQEAPVRASSLSAEDFTTRVRRRLPPAQPVRPPRSAWTAFRGAAWLASPLLLAAAWTFGQAFLGLANLGLLAAAATGTITAAAPFLHSANPLLGRLLPEQFGGILEAAPWLAPALLGFLWALSSAGLTFVFLVLVWGWVAGWWAERRANNA